MKNSKRTILEKAYFHISNSGLALKIIETSDEEFVSWDLEVRLSVFGIATSFRFPIDRTITTYLHDVLGRLMTHQAQRLGVLRGNASMHRLEDVDPRLEVPSAPTDIRFWEERGFVELTDDNSFGCRLTRRGEQHVNSHAKRFFDFCKNVSGITPDMRAFFDDRIVDDAGQVICAKGVRALFNELPSVPSRMEHLPDSDVFVAAVMTYAYARNAEWRKKKE